MKTKQLANVLIKVLGLSLCAQSVMHFVNGIFNSWASSRSPFLWSGDSGYCTRAAEPGWFRYHIAVYALQGTLAFVLPICVLSKMLF
ncbi:MAG: hypothetical protein ABSH48_19455 [Verrucomicrobiota bacterium]|jgi:hypothetical protein